ncbi:hypothetical protein J6590_030978 [Homalodisca vitripennis]|nr:hypothetical protein J6590_030978 [Homalodisca vitripennis]
MSVGERRPNQSSQENLQPSPSPRPSPKANPTTTGLGFRSKRIPGGTALRSAASYWILLSYKVELKSSYWKLL